MESILRVFQDDPPSRDGIPEASFLEEAPQILSFEQFVLFLINGTQSTKMDERLSKKFHLYEVRMELFWKKDIAKDWLYSTFELKDMH